MLFGEFTVKINDCRAKGANRGSESVEYTLITIQRPKTTSVDLYNRFWKMESANHPNLIAQKINRNHTFAANYVLQHYSVYSIHVHISRANTSMHTQY